MSPLGTRGIPRLRRRGDDRHHFFSFPSKEKKRFRASKEEKGACWKCLPQYSQTELSAQCAGSAGARSLELADACYEHCSSERPAGVGSHRGIVRFFAQCPWQASRTTKCRAAGQAAHCSVSAAEDKQRNDRRTATIGFMKSSTKKGSLETLVSSGFLVTFSPPEKVTRSRGAELPRPLAARRRRNTSSTFRRREKSRFA